MKMKLNVILINELKKKKKKRPCNSISNHFDRKPTYLELSKPTYLELTPKN